jgi:Ser/Thr protein kinase RdoA (MazF antagonist)
MAVQTLPQLTETVPAFTLPVVCSTLCAEALGRHIQLCYGLDSLLACKLWIRGLSDIYLVETRDANYVLRVSHAQWRSATEVQFELAFLDHLRQGGVSVASPLQTVAGSLALELAAPEGMRHAALFPFAPGEIPPGDLSLLQAALLGQTLAQVHVASKDFWQPCHRPALTLENLLHDSVDRLLPFFAHQPQDQDYLQGLRSQLQARLGHWSQEDPQWVVCWGDPHSGNVHFTTDPNGAHGITLFDFDQCGYGWRVFDIAKFLQTSLRTGMSYSLRQAFLQGYESGSPLEDWELEALPDWVQVAHLWSWALRLGATQLHSHSEFDQRYFNQRLHQLKSFALQNWQLI